MTCQDSASLKEPMMTRPKRANALSPKAYESISFVALDPPWQVGSSYASCIHGGTKIDIDALVRIADLFRHRLDPAVVAVLAERPYRYRALHTRLETHLGEHVDDNAVSRSLHRLTKIGAIRADSKHFGSRVIKTYSLADKGESYLTTYEALACVLAHLDMARDECDGTCPVHDGPCAKYAV